MEDKKKNQVLILASGMNTLGKLSCEQLGELTVIYNSSSDTATINEDSTVLPGTTDETR